MSTLKVGISAVFDKRITPHAATFLRGVAIAKNNVPKVADLELVFADDGASGNVAGRVAQSFVEQGVDVVVGHFSSDAAYVAAGIYEAHGIPLLLPAATASELTRTHRNVFRVCPNDWVLASRLAAHVADSDFGHVAVFSDTSRHGLLLADEARAALSARRIIHSNKDERAEALVFCGRLSTSARFLAERRKAGDSRPVLLTDDAVSPQLLGDFEAGDVRVFGFVPCPLLEGASYYLDAHHQCFGGEPDTYFAESVAALQVAAQLAKGADNIRALQGGQFHTVLGLMRFLNGECHAPIHALWRNQGQRLLVDALLDERLDLN